VDKITAAFEPSRGSSELGSPNPLTHTDQPFGLNSVILERLGPGTSF
jgi:hypothetical protein